MSTPAIARQIALYGTRHINVADAETEVKAIGFEVLEAATALSKLEDDQGVDLLAAGEMNLNGKSLEPGLYTLSGHKTSDSGKPDDRFVKVITVSAGSVNIINAKP